MNLNYCFFITGTIEPNTGHTFLMDPHQRKAEYIAVLKYYMAHYSNPIYFLENSAFNFDRDPDFLELTNKGLNILNFPRSKRQDLGKGYQEFEMLDQAIDHIGVGFDAIVKLSGRYFIKNLSELIREFQKTDVNLMMDFHRKMKVGITHTFIVRPAFYRELLSGLYFQSNDDAGKFIEHVVYDTMVQKQVRKQVSLFPVNPKVFGTSGSHGESLARNPVKMKIRNAERKVLRLFDQKEFLIEY